MGVTAITKFPERMWVYETLEASPVVYVVGSFKNGSVYELRYTKISSLGSWSTVTARRGCNSSVYPHEGVVRRGKLYIKGFPADADDTTKLGCIYLDGTGGTMNSHDWGTLGPTVPVALTSPGGWSASGKPVTVLNSWIYTYTWVKASGQESNRAPLQTNPDKSPSATGAFTNLIPAMTVTGLADTTEYPFINIYRTTDGGGSFFYLYQIANTGAGSINFSDTHLESGAGGGTFNNPLPDADLDTQHQAPSLTSNSPPPAVSPPNVTGTNSIQRSTRVVEYAARIWYAINEFVFYSANEELDEGVPEESYPSGDANPNYFRMNQGVTQLIPTPDGLLVMTRRETVLIYGTSKATFNPRPFLGNIGAAPDQRRAACQASEYQAWLTQDNSIALAHGDQFAILSNPLGTTIQTYIAAGAEIDMQFWKQADKEYLVVAAQRKDDTTATRWIVYDLDRARRVSDHYWFPPWALLTTCIATGASSASDTENKLYCALWDGTKMLLSKLDYTGVLASDPNPTSGTATGYAWSARLAPRQNPLGYHVNERRRPYMSTIGATFQYERTVFGAATWNTLTQTWDSANFAWNDAGTDSDPTVVVYVDDLFTDPITLSYSNPPQRRAQSRGFRTILLTDLQQPCKYLAFQWTGASDTLQAEIQKVNIAFLPDSGA